MDFHRDVLRLVPVLPLPDRVLLSNGRQYLQKHPGILKVAAVESPSDFSLRVSDIHPRVNSILHHKRSEIHLFDKRKDRGEHVHQWTRLILRDLRNADSTNRWLLSDLHGLQTRLHRGRRRAGSRN